MSHPEEAFALRPAQRGFLGNAHQVQTSMQCIVSLLAEAHLNKVTLTMDLFKASFPNDMSLM